MSLDETAALPVNQLMRGDAWIWLWCTWPRLRDGFTILDAWGFKYCTGGSWHKRTKNEKLAFGTGYIMRSASEPFMIGSIGAPRTYSRSVRNAIDALAQRHSEKPDEAYAACEKLFGGVRRLDMFSRKTRPGWIAWGDEAGKFDEAV
jgi:N6-adenosine-specific RNA methylase IME4